MHKNNAMLRPLLSSLPAAACRLPAARPGKALRRAVWWRSFNMTARGAATAAGGGGDEAEGEEAEQGSSEAEEETSCTPTPVAFR